MTLCSLPLIAAFLGACAAPEPIATGYVEGEHVMIAPVSVAEVARLSVARGQRVRAGAPLATQEDRDARIAVDQATATLGPGGKPAGKPASGQATRRNPRHRGRTGLGTGSGDRNPSERPCGLRRWKPGARRVRRSARMRKPR
ncbi:hypothetical protein [Rhodobacter capsulatus]|uniref:hypothetical protein n=1 Tax=Rhodobacter capsulatus TaxID=1061 RepID=UPI004027A94C